MNEAYFAILGVIIGALLTGIINYLLQRSQFQHNKEMFFLQNKSKEMVKEILSDILNHKTHIDRSFKTLTKRVGGFSDDEIRLLLHEIGAKKVIRPEDYSEWWYLKEREQERVNRKGK